jgi:hydrogenase small subunit
MAASGAVAQKTLQETLAQGGHILVVEGAVPLADERYCTVGGVPFRQTLVDCAQQAAAILAVGSCASFGGVVARTPSQGQAVSQVLQQTPVINLPMCPVHPEHVLATLVYFLQNKRAPELDLWGRPQMFFHSSVHSQCERRRYFTLQKFLLDWNDAKQSKYCLYMKGCLGRSTYSDCVSRQFNGKVNHCLSSGSPCQGCAQPSFLASEEPLYAQHHPWSDEAEEQEPKRGVA